MLLAALLLTLSPARAQESGPPVIVNGEGVMRCSDNGEAVAMLVLRSGHETGRARVTARTAGFETATTEIRVREAAP